VELYLSVASVRGSEAKWTAGCVRAAGALPGLWAVAVGMGAVPPWGALWPVCVQIERVKHITTCLVSALAIELIMCCVRIDGVMTATGSRASNHQQGGFQAEIEPETGATGAHLASFLCWFSSVRPFC
jgi:hypothetical protein